MTSSSIWKRSNDNFIMFYYVYGEDTMDVDLYLYTTTFYFPSYSLIKAL
jgi:hypothetical protein